MEIEKNTPLPNFDGKGQIPQTWPEKWWQGWRLCVAQKRGLPLAKADLITATVEYPAS